MEDLSGLDWTARPSRPSGNSPANQAPLRPTLSPSTSGRSTPLSAQVSGSQPIRSQQSIQALKSDTFSTLLSPQPSRPSAQLSLSEKQKQLQAQRGSQSTGGQDPYTIGDGQFWEGLGSGRGTPNSAERSQKFGNQAPGNDILAAFQPNNSQDPFSKPVAGRSSVHDRKHSPTQAARPSAPQAPKGVLDNDDDPFGLGGLSLAKPVQNDEPSTTDDDILGDLGKPISEISANKQTTLNREPPVLSQARRTSKDKALAELVDMGFPPERAQYALDQTESGQDVQAAISVLLNEAHGTTNGKSKGRLAQPRRASSSRSERRQRNESHEADRTEPPPWLNGTTRSSARASTKTAAPEEKEFSQYAAEIINSVYNSANTFWKTSQKRVAKAVAEYQQESDPNQPKWMRNDEVEQPEPRSEKRRASIQASQTSQATDEAAMLDAPREAPSVRHNPRPTDIRAQITPASRTTSTRPSAPAHEPNDRSRPRSARPEAPARPSQRLNRQAIEDETAQAYVSPARRRKQQPPQAEPKVDVKPTPDPTLDIFSSDPLPQTAATSKASVNVRSRTTIPTRPKTTLRQAPSVPDSTLQKSHKNWKAGTEAFKRGDYVDAHASYTSALTSLPSSHPIVIVLRCNRAITLLKSGDAKAAIADADAALEIIGPTRGEDESISLGGSEGDKQMKEFYGKALMRKAEGLESLEKWSDAAKAWRETVEAGLGGALAIQGRNRCEKAAAGAHATQTNGLAAKPKPPAKPKPRPSARQDLDVAKMGEAEAVKRLRAAEAEAVRASDEAFALTDAVEARITTWKGGKADNLRALLASLDTILWADAGWNKVGMGDLVLPNRVKIIYMKAIAKVHPDKIPQTATTEQKMISATVFAALNEAWDKFKKDNGL